MPEIDFRPTKKGIKLVGGIRILPADVSGLGNRDNGLFDRPLAMGMMDFSVLIERDGFMADVIRTFRLERLNHIHQLQSLTYLGVGQYPQPLPKQDHVFPHTRLMPHSILSGVLRALIARYIEEADPTQTRLAILEDLIHDAATCAGGDAWQNVDLPNREKKTLRRTLFNEDSHILRVFHWHRHGWQNLKRKYGLPKDTPEIALNAIGAEHGLDGALHTFTDTLSYLACDVSELKSCYKRAGLPLPVRLQPIRVLATPDIFHLWQNLEISGQKAVVNTPDILRRFLELRLELYTQIYNHPAHKLIEMVMASVVYPELWKKLSKRPEDLLHMDDGVLNELAEDEMKMKNISHRLDAFGVPPRRYAVEDKNDALWTETRQVEKGHLTLFSDYSLMRPIKTKCSKYFVKGPDGHPLPFAEAYPREARELALRANALPDNRQFHVTVFEKAKCSTQFREAWQAARERWHSTE